MQLWLHVICNNKGCQPHNVVNNENAMTILSNHRKCPNKFQHGNVRHKCQIVIISQIVVMVKYEL